MQASPLSGRHIRHPLTLAYVVLVVVTLIAVIINPGIASLGNLRIQMTIGAIIGVVSIGQTILILCGQIDLSIPWTMTLAGIAMTALHGEGAGDALAIGAALAVGLSVGIINAIGVALFRVQSLVWTLAMNTLLQGVALVYTNAQPPKSGVPALAHALALGRLFGVPIAFILWATLGAFTILLLRRSGFGRCLYATGSNPLATFFSGIDVRQAYCAAFILSGLCAAVGGILLTGYASEAYLGMGDDYLLIPIAAVVIGGTSILGGSGGYVGTVAGVLIVLVLQSTLSVAQVSQAGRDILLGAIILVMIIVYGRQQAA